MTSLFVSTVTDQYSLFDGLDLATRAVKRAQDLEQEALALTNHGGVMGLVEHYRACTDAGIKPILGMEGYITFTVEKPVSRKQLAHITLLVENATGYRNLMRLVTASQDLFYYKPRFSVQMLLDHADGLLVLSGCPSSMFGKLLAKGKAQDAEWLFRTMAERLRGRFWGELQHSQPRDLAGAILEWSQRYKVPIVATNDAHYVAPEDRPIHDLMLKMRYRGQMKGEEDATYGEGFFIPSRKQAEVLLKGTHAWMTRRDLAAALDETVRIAERVDFRFQRPERYLPDFWRAPERQIKAAAEQGLRDLGLHRKREYRERLERELALVLKKGYAPYFMVCWEFAQEAKERGILVGPRGSVCGSLLAYVLGVTMVDPLVHGTLFERFLHEERTTLPDVDLDIDSRRRDELLQWVKERYAPHAVPIVSVQRYGPGNLAMNLRDAYGLDEWDAHELRRAVTDLKWRRIYAATEEDLDYPVFEGLEAKYPGLTRTVTRLFNQARSLSQHPGGVCFVPERDPTPWLAFIQPRPNAPHRVTCYNFVDVEYLGLLKFDFLGLDAMGAIAMTNDLVKKRYGITLRLQDIPLNEPDVLARFQQANTAGVFQFETRGAREFLREIQPADFQELVAATALNRPGVSDSLQDYVSGKRDGTRGGAFGETYGAIVYQENIMQYLREQCGFTWGEADRFIKTIKGSGIQKLTSPDVRAVYQKFMDAHARLGWDAKRTEDLLNRLTRYSFNKAHGVAYTLVAYWQMYQRVRYPTEFWVAMLDLEEDDERRAGYERAAVRDGVYLLPPHIRHSAVGYTIEDDDSGNVAIRVGLKSIKSVGPKAAEAIVAARPYARPSDILRRPVRKRVTTKVVRALMEAGALDFNEDRLVRAAVRFNEARGRRHGG